MTKQKSPKAACWFCWGETLVKETDGAQKWHKCVACGATTVPAPPKG